MVVYSIRDLEKLSGVKAHTIRIWEKRYDLVNPRRTKTNIRYYTDEDLRHILNVCFLYRRGYKISKIAQMSIEVLKKKVTEYSNLDLSFEDQLDSLMIFVFDLDSHNFNQILDQHISQKGLQETMTEVIYPLLDKLGLAWLAGSFSQVHEAFVTQIIKSKILAAIEGAPDVSKSQRTYLIYLPDGQRQELSLLFFHYLLKKNKNRVVNLGTGTNLTDVTFAIQTVKPDYVFTIFNEAHKLIPLQSYVNQLSANLGKAVLLMTGYQIIAGKINWPNGVIRLASLSEAIEFTKKGKAKKTKV